MRTEQKKSLVIALILALQYIILIQWPGLLIIVLISMAVTLLVGVYYILGLKFKRERTISNLKFLILPFIFNFGAIFFLRALMLSKIVYIILLFVLIANFYLLVAIKKIYNLEERAAIFQRNIVISISFLSIFLSTSAIYRFYISYSVSSKTKIPLILVLLLVGLIFYLISYFLAWENGINLKKFRPYNLVMTLLAMETVWVSSIWVVYYPVFSSYEKARLGGSPLPAVILSILFYFLWGIISHKASKSLTKNIMFEYFLLTILFLSVLLISTRWLPQI